MKLFLCCCVSFLLLASNSSSQQVGSIDKEKLLQMAQSGAFSGMSPDQVRAIIKQSGYSEDEMSRYARERNIDFGRYLQPSPLIRGGEGALTVSPAESIRVPESQPSRRRQIATVPSFVNRPDASNLKPFGYEIFQYAPATFEPVANAPTPASYRVGPGDELILTVWGQTQLNYDLTVARDGYIVIPDVGKIQVEGQTIDQVKQRLLTRMSAVYEGLRHGKPNANTFLEISLGKIRTIQVFVLGNAQVPGGFSLSGLSNVFTAVYYAGGPDVEGSLRKIRVIGSDGVTDTIDFYDYILFGRRAADVRVRDGDAVFIPPAGPRIAITGAVSRPAIYELKQGETLGDLVAMAGGLRYSAYDKRVHIERVIPFGQRSKYEKDVLDIDVQFKDASELAASDFTLEDGDVVSVFSLNNERENLISISGNIRKPGQYELLPGMRVTDLIQKADGFFEDAFLDHATVIRTLPDLKLQVLSFVPRLALAGDTTENLPLQRLDNVIVYKEEFFHPIDTVKIDGAVRKPGAYKRTEHMRVSELIVLAGGLVDGADLSMIEIARIDTTTRTQISKTFHVSLPLDYWNTRVNDDFELSDYDHVSVRFKPDFSLLKKVVVTGEAEYAGTYSITYEGERLSSLIRRFGGFKPTAYVQGVRFLRQIGKSGISRPSPEIVESQQIDTFALRYNITIKPRLASKEVPIAIEEILDDSTSLDNLVLQDGDSLIIPRDPGVVYVEGQVYVPSSVPYKKGASLDYYLHQAGGVKRDADEDNVVVVLPNNRKWESGGFLKSGSEILSGSTIIAPLRIEEPSNTLEVLREWATIAASTTTLAFIVWQVSK